MFGHFIADRKQLKNSKMKIENQIQTFGPHSYTKSPSLLLHPSFQHNPRCNPKEREESKESLVSTFERGMSNMLWYWPAYLLPLQKQFRIQLVCMAWKPTTT